jgi:hypothetical protein
MMTMTKHGTSRIQLDDENSSLKGHHLRLRLLAGRLVELEQGKRMIFTSSRRPIERIVDEVVLETLIRIPPDHPRGQGQE